MNASRLGWIAGEAVSLMFRSAPHLCFTRSANHWSMITRERGIDYNMAWIDAGPAAGDHLASYAAEINGTGGFLQVSAAAADALEPQATELGFTPAGTAPLMICSLANLAPIADREDCHIRRVRDGADLTACHELMADAFAMDRLVVERCMGPLMLQAPGLGLFLLRTAAGQAAATVITVTAGTLLGVWSMATAQQTQRQGYGRTLMRHILTEYGPAVGATEAYLIATDAGEPLYRSLGFNIVELYTMWIREG